MVHIPSDAQTAYQSGKSCADHIFLLECLISYARKVRKKLFIVAIDFDGAFDRVSRTILLKQLILFGAGSIFIACTVKPLINGHSKRRPPPD